MDPTAYRLHAEVEKRHWWFVARRQILTSVIDELPLPRPARILEFGSGTGGNLRLLGRYGAVTAVEIDDSARAISSDGRPEARHERALTALDAGERFDLALVLDVLEHLDDPPAELRRIAAHLEPNVPLVATVPAHPWMYGQHDRFLHHRRRYTRRALHEDLEAGGFTVERLSPMNCLLFPTAVTARAVEWLLTRGVSPAPAQARGMSVPPAPINRALAAVFAAERKILHRGQLPFGLSFLAVARRR